MHYPYKTCIDKLYKEVVTRKKKMADGFVSSLLFI